MKFVAYKLPDKHSMLSVELHREVDLAIWKCHGLARSQWCRCQGWELRQGHLKNINSGRIHLRLGSTVVGTPKNTII